MATQTPSTPKSKGGRTSKKTPGVVYDKTAYYLPESHAVLLQLAEMFLKRKAEAVCTGQAILELLLLVSQNIVGLSIVYQPYGYQHLSKRSD